MILGSKTHTEGDTKRWRIDYSRWLENPANIETAVVTSSSTTCTVTAGEVLGQEVIFFLTGGVKGETLTVSVEMTDTDGNVKHDSVMFTVVGP